MRFSKTAEFQIDPKPAIRVILGDTTLFGTSPIIHVFRNLTEVIDRVVKVLKRSRSDSSLIPKEHLHEQAPQERKIAKPR